MRLLNHGVTGLVLAGMMLAFGGCWKQEETKPPPKKTPPTVAKPVEQPAKPVEQTTLTQAIEKAKSDQPVVAAIPEVKLTEDMKVASLVKVGDALPADELENTNGKKVSLGSLLGKKATVVLFWDDGDSDAAQLLAVTALEDLERDIFAPLIAKGVQVVGINVGDKPEEVSKAMTEASAKFVTLMDSKGEYFAKVTNKGKVPRVYVLDAAGKILWFDVEFSRTTRRELMQVMDLLTGGR